MRGDGSEDQFGFLNFTDFPVMIPDCAVLSPLFIKALSLFYLIEHSEDLFLNAAISLQV